VASEYIRLVVRLRPIEPAYGCASLPLGGIFLSRRNYTRQAGVAHPPSTSVTRTRAAAESPENAPLPGERQSAHHNCRPDSCWQRQCRRTNEQSRL